MFERFLLAIDDTPASEVATSFAAAVAQRSSATVHVLYVNEFLVGRRGLTVLTNEDVHRLVSNAVGELRASGVDAGGSSSTSSYRRVPNTIVEVAHARHVDAILLGSNRRRQWGRFFSPQVRERTTRLTTLPVVTAPSPLQVATLELQDMVKAQLETALSVLPG